MLLLMLVRFVRQDGASAFAWSELSSVNLLLILLSSVDNMYDEVVVVIALKMFYSGQLRLLTFTKIDIGLSIIFKKGNL